MLQGVSTVGMYPQLESKSTAKYRKKGLLRLALGFDFRAHQK